MQHKEAFMDRLLKISEKTNIIIHALAFIAAQDKGVHVSVKKIAAELQVSVTYLAKVLQPLVKKGLLLSTRGAKGGFVLEKDPSTINVLELLEMAEGKLPEHSCLFGHAICKKQSCAFTSLNEKVKSTVIEYLSDTTISNITESFL